MSEPTTDPVQQTPAPAPESPEPTVIPVSGGSAAASEA